MLTRKNTFVCVFKFSKMLHFILLVVFPVIVLGGRSPNAEYIDAFVKNSKIKYSYDVIEDAKLDVEALATKYGYPVESHRVYTEDDYILTMHRIPHGRNDRDQASSRPVAFLMHGLIATSACFMFLGPGHALAYVLADAGYDVWMGNSRGNFYSRRHMYLNPDSKTNQTYWKFSWDEMGYFDLPAFFDHIESITGQSRLHYIGHSQGGTVFLVLASLRPEYNKKIISFQGLAPASYFRHNVLPPLALLAPMAFVIEPLFYSLDMGEVFPNLGFDIWFNKNFCFAGSLLKPLCRNSLISGVSATANQALTPIFVGNTPAGGSIRQFGHYAQCISSKDFRRYDHGSLKNRALYGSRVPPAYNISAITAPVHLYCAPNDTLVNAKDVFELGAQLRHLLEVTLVNSSDFSHVDFFWGKDVKRLVYDRMLESMKEAQELGVENSFENTNSLLST